VGDRIAKQKKFLTVALEGKDIKDLILPVEPKAIIF